MTVSAASSESHRFFAPRPDDGLCSALPSLSGCLRDASEMLPSGRALGCLRGASDAGHVFHNSDAVGRFRGNHLNALVRTEAHTGNSYDEMCDGQAREEDRTWPAANGPKGSGGGSRRATSVSKHSLAVRLEATSRSMVSNSNTSVPKPHMSTAWPYIPKALGSSVADVNNISGASYCNVHTFAVISTCRR